MTMAGPLPPWLSEWLALRDLSMAEIQQRLELVNPDPDLTASYGSLDDLIEMANFDTHPGRFYFRNGRLAVLLVLEDADELRQTDRAGLVSALGEPAATLPAHTGKRHRLYVYPQRGVAFAAGDADQITFLEIFPPTTLEDYKATLYVTPPRFIR